MLKYKKIEISISYRNVNHYKKLGYDAEISKNLIINVSDLPIVSHVKVDVQCEICGVEKNIMYCKYLKNIKIHGYYGCKSCSRQKAVMTSRELYGVDNWMQLQEAKEIIAKRNIDKWGHKTTLLVPEIQDKIMTTLENKYQTSKWYEIRGTNPKKFKFLNLISKSFSIDDPQDRYEILLEDDYISYRRECRKITNRCKKIFLENWDGIDYYDGEHIIENYDLGPKDSRYPSIDHKVSIMYGYNNNIPASVIGGVENLCVTKRGINSSKRDLTEKEFLKKTVLTTNPNKIIN